MAAYCCDPSHTTGNPKQKIKIYQLGCKSGAGKKGFADKWIDETGVNKEVVDKVLENHMCCYFLKIVEE